MTQSSSILAGLTPTQIAALPASVFATLTPSDFAPLSTRQMRVMNFGQLAAIPPATLGGLDPTVFAQFSPHQMGAFSPTQIAALNVNEVGLLNPRKLANMSPAEIGAIDPNSISVLGAGRLGRLTAGQLNALTGAQLDNMSFREIRAVLTDAAHNGALAQISSTQMGSWTNLPSWGVSQLSADIVSGLSVSTFDLLLGNNVQYLYSLSGVSVADFNSLTATQFANLSGGGLDALGGSVLSQLNPAEFTATQVAALDATVVSNLSTGFFAGLSAQDLSAISLSAIPGVTVAQLQALSPSQLAAFSQNQIAAMGAAQQAVFASVNPILSQAVALESGGMLTYNGALTLLQDVAAGGMTADKFANLQAVANMVATADDIAATGLDDDIMVTAAVKQLFQNVVLGDAENATWNGGSATATSLGDLSATSTQAQFEALIGKWFLGTDLPGMTTDSTGTVMSASYQSSGLPLFGSSGAPTMTDVVQGGLADSALLAGLAETALQNASFLKSLITSNSNGTTTIEVPNFGTPLFVTVNDQLPTGAGGLAAAGGGAAWVGLMEKAAAQLSLDAENAIGHGSASLGNQYASLTVDNGAQLALFSGQYHSSESFYASFPTSLLQSELGTAAQAFNAGNNVVLQDGSNFYAVTGIDTNADTVSLYNPQGGATSTVSLSQMASGHDTLFYGVTSRAG